MTVFFLTVIVVCSVASILATSLNAKLGKVERSLKEFESRPGEVESRQSYDAAVEVYNASIARFPGILIAGVLGFKYIPVESMENITETEDENRNETEDENRIEIEDESRIEIEDESRIEIDDESRIEIDDESRIEIDDETEIV